jgi:hypothetical protein
MGPNPYQSPEERGTKPESRPRNWWKVFCLAGVGAVVIGAPGCYFISIGGVWYDQQMDQDMKNALIAIAVLSQLSIRAGAVVGAIGGLGWLVTSRR